MEFLKGIFNYNYYEKVYKRSLKYGIFYILILSLFIYSVGATVQIYKINSFIKNELGQFINSLPDFKIQNGELTVQGNEVKKYSFGNYIMVIDTSEKTNVQGLKPYQKLIYIGQYETVLKDNNVKLWSIKHTQLLGKLKLSSINKKYLVSAIPLVSMLVTHNLLTFYVIFYLIWLLFYKIWSVLILFFIATWIDNSKNVGLTYRGLFNISVHAITLSWLIKLVYYSVNLNNIVPRIIYIITYWTIAIFYISKAINIFKKHNEHIINISQEFTIE